MANLYLAVTHLLCFSMAYVPPDVESLDLDDMSTEERIEYTLDAISQQGFLKNGHTVFPLHEAARLYNIPKTTLTSRWHGGQSRKASHEHEQKLKPGHEAALVLWIIEMGRRDIPMHNTAAG